MHRSVHWSNLPRWRMGFVLLKWAWISHSASAQGETVWPTIPRLSCRESRYKAKEKWNYTECTWYRIVLTLGSRHTCLQVTGREKPVDKGESLTFLTPYIIKCTYTEVEHCQNWEQWTFYHQQEVKVRHSAQRPWSTQWVGVVLKCGSILRESNG